MKNLFPVCCAVSYVAIVVAGLSSSHARPTAATKMLGRSPQVLPGNAGACAKPGPFEENGLTDVNRILEVINHTKTATPDWEWIDEASRGPCDPDEEKMEVPPTRRRFAASTTPQSARQGARLRGW